MKFPSHPERLTTTPNQGARWVKQDIAWKPFDSEVAVQFGSEADCSNRSRAERAIMQNLPTGTVTLLFTDIAGSTHLLTQLGDRYAHVLAECRQVLRAEFGQWNGNVVDTQGDAFFVVFARATDAVSAAVAAQRTLVSHVFPQGVAVQVRMGLHTGEPQRTAEGYVGLDVHRAALIMSAGHGGQVLLSQATCSLVEQDLPEGVSPYRYRFLE